MDEVYGFQLEIGEGGHGTWVHILRNLIGYTIQVNGVDIILEDLTVADESGLAGPVWSDENDGPGDEWRGWQWPQINDVYIY